jgi:hypothetical protein
LRLRVGILVRLLSVLRLLWLLWLSVLRLSVWVLVRLLLAVWILARWVAGLHEVLLGFG